MLNQEKPKTTYEIAKKLQQYYDEQLGAQVVSIGIALDHFYIYTHQKTPITKPKWLQQDIIVKHIGKLKTT